MADAPSRIALGPVEITVTVSKDRADDTKTAGFYDSDALHINVDPNQPVSRMRVSLLHELIHACFDLMGTDMGGKAAVFTSDDHEERCVHAFAPYLLDALRKNPDLVAFLTFTEHPATNPKG